jgi:hypothetical protein
MKSETSINEAPPRSKSRDKFKMLTRDPEKREKMFDTRRKEKM